MNLSIESTIKFFLMGHPGCGKTNLIAASMFAGEEKAGWVRGNKQIIRAEITVKSETLRRIQTSVKKNEPVYVPTRRGTSFIGKLMYKAPWLAFAQTMCEVQLVDARGGDFDVMQDPDFELSDNESFVRAVASSGLEANGIIVVIPAKHFNNGPKLRFSDKYDGRVDKAYNMIASAVMVAREAKVPLVIAVNHCVTDKGQPDFKYIESTINTWLDKILPGVSQSQKPNIYFIDSIASMQHKGKWRDNIAFPILDLLSKLLPSVKLSTRNSINRFIWGDSRDLQVDCHDYICDILNAGGRR